VHMCMYICVDVCIYINMFLYRYVCMRVYMCACTYVYIACMYVRMHVRGNCPSHHHIFVYSFGGEFSGGELSVPNRTILKSLNWQMRQKQVKTSRFSVSHQKQITRATLQKPDGDL